MFYLIDETSFDKTSFRYRISNYIKENSSYNDFLKYHFKIKDIYLSYMRDDIERISFNIYNYMRNNNCNSLPIIDIFKYLTTDPILYTYRYDLPNYLMKSRPKISYIRNYNNNKHNTFDYIDIEFSMSRMDRSFNDVKLWIEKNKKYINRLIILNIKDKVENKYGIPINFLKVDNCILTKDFRLVYKLSLKEVKVEE